MLSQMSLDITLWLRRDKFGERGHIVSQGPMVILSHSSLYQHLRSSFAQTIELIEAECCGPVLMNFKFLSFRYEGEEEVEVPSYGIAMNKCRNSRMCPVGGA